MLYYVRFYDFWKYNLLQYFISVSANSRRWVLSINNKKRASLICFVNFIPTPAKNNSSYAIHCPCPRSFLVKCSCCESPPCDSFILQPLLLPGRVLLQWIVDYLAWQVLSDEVSRGVNRKGQVGLTPGLLIKNSTAACLDICVQNKWWK